MGTRKFIQPQAGIDHRASAKPGSRCECAAKSRKGNSCAAANAATSPTTSGKRHSKAKVEAGPEGGGVSAGRTEAGRKAPHNRRVHSTNRMTQVNRMVSGPPA